MISKIVGILLGLLISYLLFDILSKRLSIIIGDGIIHKYNDRCITCNNRCSINH